jgi:hypothetical protein
VMGNEKVRLKNDLKWPEVNKIDEKLTRINENQSAESK